MRQLAAILFMDVVGYSMFCKTCGDRTNGMKCTRCEKEKWK